MDFFDGRYGTFVQQGQRLRHSVEPFGYRRVGWAEMLQVVTVAVAACRRRGSGFSDEEEGIRASITGNIASDKGMTTLKDRCISFSVP